jgi:hypothetical protein
MEAVSTGNISKDQQRLLDIRCAIVES